MTKDLSFSKMNQIAVSSKKGKEENIEFDEDYYQNAIQKTKNAKFNKDKASIHTSDENCLIDPNNLEQKNESNNKKIKLDPNEENIHPQHYFKKLFVKKKKKQKTDKIKTEIRYKNSSKNIRPSFIITNNVHLKRPQYNSLYDHNLKNYFHSGHVIKVLRNNYVLTRDGEIIPSPENYMRSSEELKLQELKSNVKRMKFDDMNRSSYNIQSGRYSIDKNECSSYRKVRQNRSLNIERIDDIRNKYAFIK